MARSRDQLQAIFANLKNKRRSTKPSKSKLLTKQQNEQINIAIKSSNPQTKKRAVDQLVMGNVRLVSAIAGKYARQGHGMDFTDLVQEGNIGLIKAAQTYDPKKAQFSTHATKWIRQAIVRAIEEKGSNIRVASNIQWDKYKLNKLTQEFYQKTGREPNIDELSYMARMSKPRVETAQTTQGKTRSLNVKVKDDEDKSSERIDLIPDNETSIEDVIHLRNKRNYISNMVHNASLSNIERDVIVRSFGLVGDEPQSGAQIGRDLNLSRERIRQIQERALVKMRGDPLGKLSEFLKKTTKTRKGS